MGAGTRHWRSVQLVSEEVCKQIGAEYPADITVDRDGYGWASGGMSATCAISCEPSLSIWERWTSPGILVEPF